MFHTPRALFLWFARGQPEGRESMGNGETPRCQSRCGFAMNPKCAMHANTGANHV